MREILFRAKIKTDNAQYKKGDWVQGDYVRIIDGKRFIPHIYGKGEVIENTISQYTGLTDKNGNKIFEGDIVEFYFFDKGRKNTKTMCIEWRNSGFCMRELFRDYRLSSDFSIIEEKIFTYRGDIKIGVYQTNYSYFVEIVGNIHDNPELMRGEK